ncbi:hypothetical protein Patl1_03144 [Pistacia atlantica]|uniref:Uncharacterized protein n=1 Tax=Pistacia atlantica TaxID=434234 RepID=A0ACC1C7S6_9ROSI|nr:hypothetical protein Patl1_03144 [Pistacia atlantica]
MTKNPKKFTTLTKNCSKYCIRTATGQINAVTGIDTIQLTPNITLPNVLLVPTLETNLLSVSKLMTSYSYHFFLKHCLFQDLHTREEMGRGFKRGDLWYIHHGSKLSISANQTSEHVLENEKLICLWHQRLGHPLFGYLKHILPTLFESCNKEFKCSTWYFQKVIIKHQCHLLSFIRMYGVPQTILLLVVCDGLLPSLMTTLRLHGFF